MIDTHCHLDSEQYDEIRQEVIDESFSEGVEAIILPATDYDSLAKVQSIAETDDRLFFAAGIHPHNCDEYANAEAEIRQMIRHSKCKAVGEIGLDYYYDFHPAEKQIEVFEQQLNLAVESDLPAIIHSRNTDDDIFSCLSKMKSDKFRAVLHCYSSDLDYTKRVMDMNLMFSFTGNITFKKSNMDEVVKYIPLERIMLETDGPYMTPVPFRGKTNRPKLIKLIAGKIAYIKNIHIEEVINMTKINAKKFFGVLSVLLLVLVSSLNHSFAQEEVDERGEPIEQEEVEHRFVKPFIGIGFTPGLNTIVEAYKKDNGTEEVSYDGIFSPGAKIAITPLQWLQVDISYFYTKNKKIAEENPGLRPTEHHIFGLGTSFIFNPYQRINFGLSLGWNHIFLLNGLESAPAEVNNDNAIYAGLGLSGNFDILDAGLLNAGLRLDFAFNTSKKMGTLKLDPALREYSTMYSIFKFELMFYPKMFDFLSNN